MLAHVLGIGHQSIFKIGSAVKANLTQIKKQFSQLANHVSFTTIDLKNYCIEQGNIGQKESGILDLLLAKTAQLYLSKDVLHPFLHLRLSSDL